MPETRASTVPNILREKLLLRNRSDGLTASPSFKYDLWKREVVCETDAAAHAYSSTRCIVTCADSFTSYNKHLSVRLRSPIITLGRVTVKVEPQANVIRLVGSGTGASIWSEFTHESVRFFAPRTRTPHLLPRCTLVPH